MEEVDGKRSHNIKTFIEAEEWKVVKCLLLVVNSFCAQYTHLRADSFIVSLFNCPMR